MATLKEIRLRLKSVTNIQKITKSMKMVSAAKYAKAERELKPARNFGVSVKEFYEKSQVDTEEKPKQIKLMVAMTSDRGLCGGIHSSVCKAIKATIAEGNTPDMKLVIIGDKAKAVFSRAQPEDIALSFNNIGKQPPSFVDAGFIAENIQNAGISYDVGNLYYNIFKSVISYKTTILPFFKEDSLKQAQNLNAYDSVDDDVLKSYCEFLMVSSIYYCLKESACSEQSSRMTAMDAASKNAGEMIGKLTLTFNRTRQAVITRELIEIISGAAAL